MSKHALRHLPAIKKDIAAEKADWSAGNYFKAGADIADAVTLALGPMNPAYEEPSFRPHRYIPSPNGVPGGYINKVLAGLIYGMTKDNQLTEIESCFTTAEATFPEVEHELLKAISDFKAGGWDNIVQGVLEIGLVALQLP